ncbi:hypothetical protein [Dictyobacter arantiisoli]|uniref:Uncharacterized protein n=1 Tax=Dictyobacter arantiisoli TaxID=2014874 RepID=A0A5A5TF15_9CHLR|nr:hypothetical protein [Dictyobacter arantiisoli]GCF10161.1 hypothetical protein KDI_37250 [Dictyobacter arantiisoli]
MQMLHSSNAWSYSIDFDGMIDFCIWTLQADGLHVPPFDQHVNRDSSLRAAGLTARDWEVWLQQVIHQQSAQKQALQRLAATNPLKPLQNLSARQVLEPQYPYVVWDGNQAVRERLAELWGQYTSVASQRKKRALEFGRALRNAEQQSGKRLYDELRPYHALIPPLTIYLIRYELPLDCLIPPATLLMTIQDGQPEPEEFWGRVRAAVAELVGQSSPRNRPSLSTDAKEKQGSHSNALYRTYARRPIPPVSHVPHVPHVPPRQELPNRDVLARQAVVEHLGKQHEFYGNIDFATLQFLREKSTAGWKLYEATFQGINREQQRFVFLLQQNEDGTWHFISGGSSIDMQNQWFKLVAPVRDHPLIFLTVSWTIFGNQQLLQTAYGHVIDNGFHIKRVRLINQAGQQLEDAVEDGYVFFACRPEQQIKLPMQAELYDQHNKLIWRQTIPDQAP